MGTVTYTQVQELVKQLPPAKLGRVYRMIREMTKKEPDTDTGSSQLDFINLPLSQRRKLMKQQAKQMTAYYKETAMERGEWQGGDFIDEY